MKITVITVCFNSESTIQDCISSVMHQKNVDWEYILIDGASKDGTLAIISKTAAQNPSKIRYISEPDQGIYDAMNKGIALASGDIIGFLNADDFLTDETSLYSIQSAIESSGADGCFGDLNLVDPNNLNRTLRHWVGGPMPKSKMLLGWHPAHPTFYIKSKYIKGESGFKTNLRIAADYELMLRMIQKIGCNLVYIPKVLVTMRAGGASNGTVKGIVKANLQCIEAWRINNLKAPLLLIPCKLTWKVFQRLRSAFSRQQMERVN